MIGYVYTKKSSTKPITQIALDGEFTYSQACTDESSDSRVTILPSIAITQPSPSSRRKKDCETVFQANNDDVGTDGRKAKLSSVSFHNKRKSSSAGSLIGRRTSEADNLPERKDAPSKYSDRRHQSVPCATSRGKSDDNHSSFLPNEKSSTMYFCGDDARLSYKGILIPKLTDNFADSHLEAAYQKYSHRQRQKSLLILNLIDVAVKIAFFFALLIHIRELSGRIRIPIQELIYIIPWIFGNSIIIGLITCSNKCANHYLHLAALLTIFLFTLESYLVFGIAAPNSFSIMGSSTGSVWYTIFVMFAIYSMMPLPLTWCIACSSASCIADLLIMLISNYEKGNAFFWKVSILNLHSVSCLTWRVQCTFCY